MWRSGINTYSTAPKRSCIPSGNQTWPMENPLQVEISSWETHLWGCVRCRLIVGLFPIPWRCPLLHSRGCEMYRHIFFWGDDNPYLVGGTPIPLKIWKSLGMMKFPTEWKNKIHVPNHQPDKFQRFLMWTTRGTGWHVLTLPHLMT